MKATLRQLLVVALLSIASLCPARAQSWQIHAGANLAACVVGNQTFLTGGAYGRIVRSDDGGVSWRLQESGTRHSINAISFIDSVHGLAVCDGGLTLRTDDGGSHWNPVPSPVTGALLDVQMISRDVALACGEEATILRTQNGGRTWQRISQFPGDGAYYSLCWLGNGVGVAVGDSGRIFRTSDGGDVWTRVISGLDARLHKVRFNDATHGVIVGNEGVTLVSSDGGRTWGGVMQDPTAFFIRSVAWADQWRVVAVGYSIAGTGILESTNGGGNWSNQGQFGLGPDVAIYDVAFGQDGKGIAVGGESSILRTTDYGQTWQIASYVSISEDGDPRYFSDVKFRDRLNGAFIDGKGRIYRTSDGGGSWRFTDLPGTPAVSSFAFTGKDSILVALYGPGLMQSTDGGETFSQAPFVTTPQRKGYLFAGLQMTTPRIGYLGAGGIDSVIWRTTDAGATWRGSTIDTGLFSTGSFIFSSPDTGFTVVTAVTPKGATPLTRAYRTVDGGTNWSRITMPVDTGLSVLALRNGALGFAGGGGYIYRTEDGGRNWSKVWGEAGKYVWNIVMVNDTFGVASGYQYLLLVTTDAGRSWHRVDIWEGASYDVQGWFAGLAAPDRQTVIGVGRGAVVAFDITAGTNVASVETSRPDLGSIGAAPEHAMLHAYPNPWHDGPLTIEIPDAGGATPVRVELHDLLGRRVADIEADVARRSDGSMALSIPRERIPGEGVYLIRVIAGDRTGAERVIVTR